jgi:hypothetical protein
MAKNHGPSWGSAVDAADPRRIDLFAFRPTASGAALDAAVRESVVPRLLSSPGLVEAYAGRQGPDELGGRLLVSVWSIGDVAEVDAISGLGCFRPDLEDEIRVERFASLPIGLFLTFDQQHDPAVLRVFRGEVRAGELDAYVEEASQGILADAFAPFAPNALYLGIERPDRFVTVSVWSAWSSIEQGTGGDIDHAVGTPNAERVSATEVAHYELLPDVPRLGAAARPSAP